MENKDGILTFGTGSRGIYLKGGGLQQDCRAGTNTGRAGGGAEGNGRMRAEHRVMLLREEFTPGTPIPTHLGLP